MLKANKPRNVHLLDGRKTRYVLPEVGNKLMVFQDPISREQPEGLATITKVLSSTGWNDASGNPMFRCNVRFKGGLHVCERDVSKA